MNLKHTLLLCLAASALSTANAANLRHLSAPTRHYAAQRSNSVATPEGTPRYYSMDGYIYESIGLEYVKGMANRVYTTDDGKTVYIGSIFPNTFRTDDMWLKGSVSKAPESDYEIVTIDCKTPAFRAGYDEIFVGEVYIDEDTGEALVKDIELIKKGDHIYIDDNKDDYSRCLIAYTDDYGDIETVDVAYCLDLKPYEGNTDDVKVPATAERKDYIYYSLDTYGELTAIRSTVATDGNDYYFDTLIPNIAPAWVKGSRSGNTITVPAGQFMGADCGYYLYGSAFRPTGYDEAEGQYIGQACDMTFTVDDSGTITFATPAPSLITALQNDGRQYDCVYENVITPYLGDTPAVPSDPKEVMWYDYSATGAYAIDFVLNNISTERTYLNPECLGYYIYLDGEKVTFTREQYGAIHTEEMTLVPFGYSDAYGYDFYSAGGWNEVFVYTDDFESLGVQAVYTVDGVTRESNIINVHKDGDIEIVEPVGIGTISLDSSEGGESYLSTRSWYDLAGRRILPSIGGVGGGCGLSIGGGKVVIR